MGLVQDFLAWVRPSRSLPQPMADGVPMQARSSRYGELLASPIMPSLHNLADEGSLWVAMNATIGTGVAHALVTAYSDTSGLLALKNNGAKRIYLHRLVLMLTAAPTAGVSLEFAVRMDGSNSRQPSANSVNAVPVNILGPAADPAPPSTGLLVQAFNAGALTLPASSNASRTVDRIKMPVGLNVVGDVYEIVFGRPDPGASIGPLTAIKAAQPARVVAEAAPVVILPSEWCTIHRWSLTEATGAPSYEWALFYSER